MPKRIRKDAKVALLTNVDLLSGCTKKEIQEIASLSTEWDAKADFGTATGSIDRL